MKLSLLFAAKLYLLLGWYSSSTTSSAFIVPIVTSTITKRKPCPLAIPDLLPQRQYHSRIFLSDDSSLNTGIETNVDSSSGDDTTDRSSINDNNDTKSIVFEDVSSVANNHNLGFSILEQEMDNVEIVNDYRPITQQQQQSTISEDTFVKMFRGSANYIAYHRGSTFVLHIPASLFNIHAENDDSNSNSNESNNDTKDNSASYYENLLDDVALLWLLGIKVVIILGCRELLDERLNADITAVEPVTHKGIRVTDAKLLRYLKEEAGYARFEVERQLARALRQKQNASTPTSGGNVVSGNFFSAKPVGVRDGIDFAYTGLLRKVEVEKIRQAHANNDVVILTSLGVSPTGELFSVKSESLTAGVASSLKANKIIFLLKEPCHIREVETENTIMSLRLADAKRLLKNFGVTVNESTGEYVSDNVKKNHHSTTQFLERIGFCTNALNAGVQRAHLICPSDGSLLEELFTIDAGSATMISRDLYDGIRRAQVDDVVGIAKLIQPLVDSGTIVERSTTTLENEIQTFYVYTRDDVVIACGQLKRYEGGYAEIGCLAVQSDYRKIGKGDAMLSYLERIGLTSGASTLFVLSTQAMQWFIERGFREVGIDALPLSRRAVYNHKRRSKIYMKNLRGMRDIDAEELMWDR